MNNPAARVSVPASESDNYLEDRIAWICLLAAVVLVPLSTTLRIGRPWGFYSLTEDPYHVPKLLVLAVLVLAATVAWLWGAIARRRALRFGPTSAAAGAFAALVLVSTLVSPQAALSYFGVSGLMTGASTWLISLWTGVLLAQYTSTGSRLLQLSRTVGYTGAGVALLALLQSLRIDPLGTSVSTEFLWMIAQGMATTGNPNYTGILLVVPAVVLLALALAEEQTWRRGVSAAGAALTALALFSTLTRAAWIGLTIGIIAGVLLLPTARTALRRWLPALAIVVLGIVGAAIYLNRADVVAVRFTSLTEGLESFSTGRMTLWGDVARVVAAHPLAGSGADRLGTAAYPYQSEIVTDGISRLVLQDPHSMPILVAAIFGVPALIAMLALIVLTLRTGFTQLATAAGAERMRLLYGGWVAGLCGLLAASLVSVTTITLVFILFVAIGVVSAPGLRRVQSPLWPTPAVGCLAIALIAAGTWGAWRSAAASYELVSSRYADTERHLKRAVELVPWDGSVRASYLSRKIGAMLPVLRGDDVNGARALTAQIDAEIRLAEADFPDELLLPRLRILLYDAARGFPGYQLEAHRAAVEEALAAFPGDSEFEKMLQELDSR